MIYWYMYLKIVWIYCICYQILHVFWSIIALEFMKLCEIWHMETWTWMGHFQTDMLIYQAGMTTHLIFHNHLLLNIINYLVIMHRFFQGAFADAIAHLQNFSSTIKENMQLRSNLQMACCFYCLQKYSVRSSQIHY